MKIKITTDSTCDLSPQILQAHDVSVIPLGIVMDGKVYKDGVDIVPMDIFSHVAQGGELCTTAAANVGEYVDFFAPFAKEYEAVIHVSVGSGFSSCCQNAGIAAQEFDNVYVVDSRNFCCGQGAIALEAAKRTASCTDPAALCDEIRELAKRVECSFLINQLDYLVKGGRCSAVLALGANLLKLKPCLEVTNNEIRVGKKYRGSFAKCVAQYAKDKMEGREDLDWSVLYLPSARVDQEELDTARAAAQHFGQFKKVEESEAGCAISCHCGPHTLAFIFLRKE